MTRCYMRFLNTRRAGGRYMNRKINNFCNVSSILTGKGNGYQSHLFGHFQTFQNIDGIAASADALGNISGLTYSSYLLAEYFRKIIVITNTRNNGSISS